MDGFTSRGKKYIVSGDRLQFLYTSFPWQDPTGYFPTMGVGGFVALNNIDGPYIKGAIKTSKSLNIFGDKSCQHVKIDGYLRSKIPIWDNKAAEQRLSFSGGTFVYPHGHSKCPDNSTAAANIALKNSDATYSISSGATRASDSVLIDWYHSGTYYVEGWTSPLLRYSSHTQGFELKYELLEKSINPDGQHIKARISADIFHRNTNKWPSSSSWVTETPDEGNGITQYRSTFSYLVDLQLSRVDSSSGPYLTVKSYSFTVESLRVNINRRGRVLPEERWESVVNTRYCGCVIPRNILRSSAVSFQAAAEYSAELLRRSDAIFWRDMADCLAAGENQWASQSVVAAVENTHIVDTNSIDFLRDLPTLAPSITKAMKDIAQVKKGNVKALADLYLIFKYCWKTTLSDAKAYRSAQSSRIKKVLGHLVAQGRSSTLTETLNGHQVVRNSWCKIYYEYCDIGALTRVYRAAWQWGLFPTAKNIWDLIPFSFVVDWFLNLDQLVSSIDHAYGSNYIYHVPSCVYTFKSVHNCALVALPPDIVGSVSTVTYSREVRNSLPPMPLWTTSLSFPKHHAWEAAALIIQRVR